VVVGRKRGAACAPSERLMNSSMIPLSMWSHDEREGSA
jgi:hypothetical protein